MGLSALLPRAHHGAVPHFAISASKVFSLLLIRKPPWRYVTLAFYHQETFDIRFDYFTSTTMSNISDKLPSIFAVVVGIDEYKEFPPLTSAVADARKIATFLTDRFNVPADNIISLHDSKATKEGIIGALSSLPQRPAIRRNDAILFFFSGYAGQAKSDESNNESPVGLICPADIDEQTGIPDATLVQLFDHISKSLGNNIVCGYFLCLVKVLT